MIAFEIPGEPVAFARAGSNGKRRYTPTPQASYMRAVGFKAKEAMRGVKIFKGPVEVIIRASYVPPKSWKPAKRLSAKWKTSTPDADNIAKLVKDAIKGIVYRDDAQVASLNVKKKYGVYASLVVTVSDLENAS